MAVLNVLASQVATALDTLNFALATERNQQSDTRVSPRPHGIPGTDCALASSQSASRLIDLALLLESEPGLWILPPPGIYRPYPRLVRHIGMPLTALLVAVQSQCWIGCHRQDLLLPYPLAVDANQDRHRQPHLIRSRMVQFVHIQVLHRSVHLPRWFMIARFLQKPIQKFKQAWKVYQQLEARASGAVHRKNQRLPED